MGFVRLKEVNIKDMLNETIKLVFVATGVSVRPQKNGGEYLAFTMMDSGAEYDAKIFSVTSTDKEKVVDGRVYEAVIDVKPYTTSAGTVASCIVKDIEISDMPVEEFANWVPNIMEHINAVLGHLEKLGGTVYEDITKGILSRHWDKMVRWAAAKSMHHNELGGLMFHTRCVADVGISLAEKYNEIHGKNFVNIDLLRAGALLHDVMKVKELEVNTVNSVVNYSDGAALSTHIVDIITEVEIEAHERDLRDTEEIKLLKHLLMSHHGEREYGSPMVPSCPEAYLLHKADEIDAEMWRYNRQLKELLPGEVSTNWVGGSLSVVYKDLSKINSDTLDTMEI